MPWPWFPPKGKPEKKAVFSPHCGDETTTYYNRAVEIPRIRIGFSRTNRLKLWGSSVCCEGSSIFGGFPLKGMAEPIAFYRENRRSKAAFPIRKRPHVRYRPDMGPLHHILKGTKSFMPSRGWGTRRAGPLPLFQAFPDVFQAGKDRANGCSLRFF